MTIPRQAGYEREYSPGDGSHREQRSRERAYTTDVPRERPLSELFNELSRQMNTMLRQEMQLARLEMKNRMAKAGRNAAMLAGGGLILYAGFLGLMITAVIALANVMELWLAALIVGGVVAIIGAIMIGVGYGQLKQIDMVPRRTVDSLQESAEWLKQEIR